MRAVVKSIDLNGLADFDQYRPEDDECFGVWMTIQVGPEGDEGGHLFQILACSPEWLKRECRSSGAVWGRHMLIVSEYNEDILKKEISNYVESCSGATFWDVAQKVARIGSWEFEDYAP